MRAALRKSLIRVVPAWLHPHLRSMQFVATPLIGRALRRLPASSRRFGPPRKIAASLAGHVDQLRRDRGSDAASYRVLRGPDALSRMLPRSADPEIHFEFFNELTRISPPAGVGAIAGGRVITRNGVVIGPDDSFIADVGETFFSEDPAAHPIFLAPKLPRVTHVDGSVAVLTNFRSDIYYHWIFDTLPRLKLLKDSGFAYDKIVVPARSSFQRESLDLLGIDHARIISDPGLQVEADRLIVPTLPGTVGNPPGWACDFLRRSFLPHLGVRGPQTRRIYIARGDDATRRITNEPQLLRVLEREGFEIVRPEERRFLDQVRLFDEADIVIGAHGSGLSNLVFCRAGTHVIELFSPHYVTVPYWALANQVGLNYSYVMGDGSWERARGRGRRIHDDIRIDVAKVEAALDACRGARVPAEAQTAERELRPDSPGISGRSAVVREATPVGK
jgi:Glycosyltransferase 61